jgi:hypothetical protein
MLTRMEIPGAAAAGTAAVPWLVLGVVVGVGLVVLVGLGTALLLRSRSTGAVAAAEAITDVDDLPGFLESPPGSATTAPPAGWAPLAAVPAPPARAQPVEPGRRSRRDSVVVMGAMAVAALLLLGAAAAVAATSRSGKPSRTSSPATSSAPAGAAARLTFGGVVLEPRAVGITATYPVVELSADGDRTRARVVFPTFNCLTGDAPADPVAAGCTRSVTEYAELSSPELGIGTDGDGLRITGRFPTELRPNGSAPTATGRVYELRITVTPNGGVGEDGWRPARGVLELGPQRTTTVGEPGLNVLRSPS